MPKESLDYPDVGSFVNQGVTATVPKHMRVNLQMLQTGRTRCFGEHEPDGDA